MKYPRVIYVIFPLGDNGKAQGVYVGSTANLEQRLEYHLNPKNTAKSQKELHALMRKNGFAYGVIGEINGVLDNHLEYDWIDFFAKNYRELKVHNTVLGKGANWHKLDYPQGQINQFTIKSWDKVYSVFKTIK